MGSSPVDVSGSLARGPRIPQSESGSTTVPAMTNLYDFDMKSITGDDVSLADYGDQVCLIVNVASK